MSTRDLVCVVCGVAERTRGGDVHHFNTNDYLERDDDICDKCCAEFINWSRAVDFAIWLDSKRPEVVTPPCVDNP